MGLEHHTTEVVRGWISRVEALRALNQTRCRCFYAGNAFAFPAARKGVPGTYLGETLAGAAATLDTIV